MKRKVFRAPVHLKEEGKEGEEGMFEAVFSTFDVRDLHGDVTVAGAFSDQEVVIEPWNHGWAGPPVGKGIIKSDKKEARIEGEFFLDTTAGQEHYKTVKNLGGLVEWSYTFDVLEAEKGKFNGEEVQFLRRLDVVGVGPVTRGAGIDTRTERIKQAASGGDEGEVQQGKPSRPAEVMLARIKIFELEE